MELSYDYVNDKLSKRSKNIFSVLASSNRIDILKILNTKGALTYSELKAHTGFKSKKESGKFAYHLRKLLKYSLIASNKGEKKYIITNRGKDILNFVKQIEERSIMESGKVYVKSFNGFYELSTYKIAQILIRDASMSPDAASKIAEEVEAKMTKFEISYLTHPLMIEIINSTLIEHGYEEFRARLARLGIYTYELGRLLSDRIDIEELNSTIISNIFAEYMLFFNLPKDLVDQHIEGNINISTSNLSSILPDIIFVDASNIVESYSLISLIQNLSKEIAREIVITNLRLGLDSKSIAKIFSLINCNKIISFSINDTNMLEGYREYLSKERFPNISIIVKPDKIERGVLLDILKNNGLVAISRDERSINGIKRVNSNDIVINAISINLPRIAYESNKDEEYFRAKLVMIMKTISDAISSKKDITTRFIDEKILPELSKMNGSIRCMINLVDPYTAIKRVLGYDNVLEIIEKSIDTARDSINENDIILTMIKDECVSRLAELDRERYGKIVNVTKYEPYLMVEDDILDGYNSIDRKLDGLSLILDMNKDNYIVEKAFDELQFFIPRI
ncbi:MAG: helix-turn-helix domain-containing protein [Candidatus Nitrosocaldaceae archaeon]